MAAMFISSQILIVLLVPLWSSVSQTWGTTGPRLQISHSELKNGSAVFWEPGVQAGLQVLLLDEDHGWLLVGGKDHVYLLDSDRLDQPAHSIYWPPPREHVELCILAGKSPENECANFVRLLQTVNKTHVFVCGTGAFNPQCGFLLLGRHTQTTFSIFDVPESGRGKCPFSPTEPFTALLTDGELYAGTSVDFMGANAAVFRTSVQGNVHHYIRTEAFDHNWLNEPEFVGSFSVPDTLSPDDDKVYFFFREAAVEAGQWDKRVFSRVARVCKVDPYGRDGSDSGVSLSSPVSQNDVGGKRSLINRWTTFLKARLVCSVPGPSGIDTHFDQLVDVFILETKDPQNPIVYGVFGTSSSVFIGSAVCVYSMASIRAAFNGPFAHRESPDHRWVEFKGRVPYPRPGACPSATNDALYRSTKDFPDDVVSFMRQHQLMWEPVVPLEGRPVLTRVNVPYRLTRVVVDQVEVDGRPYYVLHLGTDHGKLLKTVMREDYMSEVILLEELTVFQSPSPVLGLELSTKKQQVYVLGEGALVQLEVQRCERYGPDCASCCLAKDPYCSWDGQTCSRLFPNSKRRSRRQDVKHGDPWSQCPATEESDSVPVQTLFAVAGNSSFLECESRLPQMNVSWAVKRHDGAQTTAPEILTFHTDDGRHLHISRGLLVLRLQPEDSGLYTCSVREHSYTRILARYRLHVVPDLLLRAHRHHDQQGTLGTAELKGFLGHTEARPQPLPGHSSLWPPRQQLVRSYKDLLMGGTADLDRHCEQLWLREKRRQQKLRALKLKQESKKARVRRNYPPESRL
ncbi:semaphorin-3D isoform X2 [Synchiropus splendidus]|uniref:semaphorin-3D isoform X2 n=1 Tax=Synchiropus splendidus TaxID=270530 RepID=UPI00237EB7E9|nr:semaphorin-3D isoform X2 [Synchiropus splendidus]